MEREGILLIRSEANACLELLKGHTPEQRDQWSNSTKEVEKLAILLLETTEAMLQMAGDIRYYESKEQPDW